MGLGQKRERVSPLAEDAALPKSIFDKKGAEAERCSLVESRTNAFTLLQTFNTFPQLQK